MMTVHLLHRLQSHPYLCTPLLLFLYSSVLSLFKSRISLSSVILPCTSLLKATTGAIPHAPTQLTFSTVNFKSFDVSSPVGISSSIKSLFNSLSEPFTWQAVPRQTVITFLPFGFK